MFFSNFLAYNGQFWGKWGHDPQTKFISICSTLIFLAHDVKYTSLTSKWPQKVFFSFFLAYNGQFWGKQGHDPPKKVYQRMRTRNSLNFLWVH